MCSGSSPCQLSQECLLFCYDNPRPLTPWCPPCHLWHGDHCHCPGTRTWGQRGTRRRCDQARAGMTPWIDDNKLQTVYKQLGYCEVVSSSVKYQGPGESWEILQWDRYHTRSISRGRSQRNISSHQQNCAHYIKITRAEKESVSYNVFVIEKK